VLILSVGMYLGDLCQTAERPATMRKSDDQKSPMKASMSGDRLPPVHPGEVLRLDFLELLGISHYALAKAIGVPPQRVLAIVQGRRAVTADTALRLGRYFAVESLLWLNLQTRYDLDHARMPWAIGWSGRSPRGRRKAHRCEPMRLPNVASCP
jgi:addiction module HigA family antidote